ncbi:helix-turn-helix domain-containing protein [Ornithinibacillus sp. BX22]|uniref:Helix-turn-helix domain-containing protein n=1 Tax=Ornithinibacillus hominis TaxID=2763055 RepID=A0A923L2D8_9BACI|nr:helix-turn-helix domain-containing protein [Ornithinibacillus hominis]MBC5635207.1 helix-turn-helix domain-containing protein [Ornithinibacillus hominis]
MNYEYEQINYKKDLPINVFTHTVEHFPYHWHEDMEILFVLEGALEIRVGQDSYDLEVGDIFLVNGSELHFINSKTDYGKTHVLVLQINSDYLREQHLDIKHKRFFIYSKDLGNVSKDVMDDLKFILANMMDLTINRKNLYELKVKKWLLELLVILMEHFEVPQEEDYDELAKDERLLEILKYMNMHSARSDLSLQDISEAFSLNPQYLSRYFKAKVGVTIKKKLDSMRLNKSLMELQTTDLTVTEIALKYGFPDSKAYYRVFKEILGITPSEYREHYHFELEQHVSKDYLSINNRESLTNLFKHLHREKSNHPVVKTEARNLSVDLTNTKRKIEHTFTNLLTFGYAPLALRTDFKAQLHQIQEEIGFRYVRFHDVLTDRLLVYNEKSDGSYYFNFHNIDVVLDNLLEANVKPFLEIGFMPKQLATTTETIFLWDAHVSPPKQMLRWKELIDAFTRHVINRYGLEEVRTWYFEFWNEPEVEYFWRGTREEFFTLYAETYKTIKAIDPELKVGGFSSVNFSRYEEWLKAFNQLVEKEGIGLDFFSAHVYNFTRKPAEEIKHTDKKASISAESVTQFSSIMLGDEHNLTKSIDSVIEKGKELSTTDEIWLTEWNSNSDSKDLLHDTCYMAPLIVKTSIENFEKVKGMGYWTFTDIFEEFSQEMSLFHGGFGLMTYNGIKKAGYHGFFFLSKLGDELILKREDMIVTKRGENYQILIFHYLHPNRLYRTFDYSQLSEHNRYTVFEEERDRQYTILLKGIQGKYTVKKQYVNREKGSAYDAWVAMGAPSTLDREALSYLKGRAEPGIYVEDVEVRGDYTLTTSLQPHEIQLIELKKRY